MKWIPSFLLYRGMNMISSLCDVIIIYHQHCRTEVSEHKYSLVHEDNPVNIISSLLLQSCVSSMWWVMITLLMFSISHQLCEAVSTVQPQQLEQLVVVDLISYHANRHNSSKTSIFCHFLYRYEIRVKLCQTPCQNRMSVCAWPWRWLISLQTSG